MKQRNFTEVTWQNNFQTSFCGLKNSLRSEDIRKKMQMICEQEILKNIYKGLKTSVGFISNMFKNDYGIKMTPQTVQNFIFNKNAWYTL